MRLSQWVSGRAAWTRRREWAWNRLVSLTLARVLRQSWSTIAGKVRFGLDEIDRADELGRELLAALGAREAPNVEVLEQQGHVWRNAA